MAGFVTGIWLLIAPILFANRSAVPAMILAVLVPYLLLPEAYAIELPGLPDLDKTSVITLGLLSGLLLFRPKFDSWVNAHPASSKNPQIGRIIIALIVIMVVGVFLTIFNNTETLRFGPRVLSGLRPWDAISFVSSLTFVLVPYLFGRKYFAGLEAQQLLLRAIVIAGLLYTALMLVEVRMSPQLHNWVYGYHQHSFAQHVRGGYRPKVFLQHGLWVGFWTFTAFVCALALWKIEKKQKWLLAAIWLFMNLVLSRNFGATGLGLAMTVVFLFTWQKLQIRIIAIIAVAVLIFPMLRQAQLFPTDQIVSIAASISQDRADSLGFRFDNEDALLARALEKPLTGWGLFAREQIYRDLDGKILSITEGRWTQTIGVQGWIGYLSLFGLLTLPLILLGSVRKRKDIPTETIALALIAAGNLAYMIPNSTLTPVGLLIFGALAGFIQYDEETSQSAAADLPQPDRRAIRYTRFPNGNVPARRHIRRQT